MARAEIHIQLAVDFADDPKIRALARYGRDARAVRDLYVQMVCYCKRTMSDGVVPVEQVGVLVYPDSARVGIRDADRLVEAGLVETRSDGYYVPAYLKRNKPRARILADSERKQQAAVKANHERWHGDKKSADCPLCYPDTDPATDPSSDDDRTALGQRSESTETETETETKSEALCGYVDPFPLAPLPAREVGGIATTKDHDCDGGWVNQTADVLVRCPTCKPIRAVS